MTDSIQVDDIKNSKGIAIGPGATAHVIEIHLPSDSASAYEAPPLPSRDALPDVGDLPPGSRPVHGRYSQFTGREKELLDLATILLHDNGSNTAVIAQPAIASGMGGIGKTQLAV
ncbi:MAG: hypothetical protein GY803_20550, partial [Chloroflexi bacterium]|nr:hypothetical protein [Chloroflexota bacterium]